MPQHSWVGTLRRMVPELCSPDQLLLDCLMRMQDMKRQTTTRLQRFGQTAQAMGATQLKLVVHQLWLLVQQAMETQKLFLL